MQNAQAMQNRSLGSTHRESLDLGRTHCIPDTEHGFAAHAQVFRTEPLPVWSLA